MILLCILILYTLLVVPTINRMGIGWDEQVDLEIARGYLNIRGLFFGIPQDLSQTRLPMYLVALFYRLLNVNDLLTARWISIVVGVVTIFGTYLFAKTLFNNKIALLAAGLLAINPFFLSFARLAFTESDIYLACTLIWLLITLARLLKKATIGCAALVGILLGLSVSAKGTAIVVLPAVWAVLLYAHSAKSKNKTVDYSLTSNYVSARKVFLWAIFATSILLFGVISGILLNLSYRSAPYRLLHYGIVCFGWLIVLVWAFRLRNNTSNDISLAAFITGFGLLTFVIFPPDHLTNSGILQSIFSRAENELSLKLSFIGELAALHFLAIFLKSTPILGLALIAGYIASAFQWRQHDLMLPLLIVMAYFVGLLLLPLAQTFYTVPILPILSVLAANMFYRLWMNTRKAALILISLMLISWGIEMVKVYPDYHLNGYQWLGERALFGRSSIGYRSIVYTPSDGVQQAVDWLNMNAKPDQVAKFYVYEWHIVRNLAKDQEYQIKNGFDDYTVSIPDYVVVHINTILQQGHGTETPVGNIVQYPFDYDALNQNYEKVFVVRRAFDIEMASIWKRN